MERLKKILAVVCAVAVTFFVLAASLLAINTFVGGDVGHFFEPSSALGAAGTVLALFFPFLLTILFLLVGVIFGKYKQIGLFAGCTGVLAVTHFLSPFATQFLFAEPAKEGFGHFVQAVFTVLAMPANSLPYAFNNAVNLFLTDFSGSRIFVFIATFLTYAAPIIMTIGFLIGFKAQNKQQQPKEIEA